MITVPMFYKYINYKLAIKVQCFEKKMPVMPKIKCFRNKIKYISIHYHSKHYVPYYVLPLEH